jgi:hypothetical protein
MMNIIEVDLKFEIVVINSIAKDCSCHLQEVFELLKIHSSQNFTLKKCWSIQF